MLVVSGSGLFGRYFYTRIHHGLHGRKANLAELKDYAEKLRWVTTERLVPARPGRSRIEAEEQADRRSLPAGVPLLARPFACAVRRLRARRRLRRHVRRVAAWRGQPSAAPRRAGRPSATRPSRYIDDRLCATRRVVEFAAFERLFSLWHALHLPLFMMLLIAGIVHVVAVHVY